MFNFNVPFQFCTRRVDEVCQQCATCPSHQASTQAQPQHPLWHSADPLRPGGEAWKPLAHVEGRPLTPATKGQSWLHLQATRGPEHSLGGNSRSQPCSVSQGADLVSQPNASVQKRGSAGMKCLLRGREHTLGVQGRSCGQAGLGVLASSSASGFKLGWNGCPCQDLLCLNSSRARCCSTASGVRDVALKSGAQGHPVTAKELVSQASQEEASHAHGIRGRLWQLRLSALFPPLGSLL